MYRTTVNTEIIVLSAVRLKNIKIFPPASLSNIGRLIFSCSRFNSLAKLHFLYLLGLLFIKIHVFPDYFDDIAVNYYRMPDMVKSININNLKYALLESQLFIDILFVFRKEENSKKKFSPKSAQNSSRLS